MLIASLLYVIGLALFVSAKISIKAKGFPITYGSSAMTARNKKRYFAGYGLMIAGILLLLILVAAK